MSRLDSTFAALRMKGRRALVTFVTAGHPDLGRSADILLSLDSAGADVIEVGVPFSDPVADGPVIQRASERALRSGTTLASVLDLIATVRPSVKAPIVLFSYANPIYRMGVTAFGNRAAKAGVDGVLVVDLPVEEAEELDEVTATRGIDHIFLVSPTTSDARMDVMVKSARGFLYAISRLGVTGTQETFAEDASLLVSRIRSRSGLTIALGFGVSTPGHVRQAVRFADAAVVGSGLVKVIEDHANAPDLLQRVEAHVRWLRTGLENPAPVGAS